MAEAARNDHGEESPHDAARRRVRSLLERDGERIGLPPTAAEVFARNCHLSWWTHGQTILPTIGGQEAVHLLVSGAATVLVCTRAGTRPLTLGFVRPGRFLGLSSLFDPPHPRLFRAQALTDCCVAALSHDALAQMVASVPPGAAFQMLAHSWRILSSVLYRKCRSLSAPLRERLLGELQTIAADFGVPHERGCLIDLELTCDALAGLTATTAARVARGLRRLTDEGILEVEGSRLILLPSPDDEESVAPSSGRWIERYGS
jgi:CRP-like cAMP-binding protein